MDYFYNEKYPECFICKKNNIELSNLGFSENSCSSSWVITVSISKCNTYNTHGYDSTLQTQVQEKSNLRDLSRQKNKKGEKNFCLNYLDLSDRIVFQPGIIQMTASSIFLLTLHVQI